jgi:hypothetical protein
MSIVYRYIKGSNLTAAEVDGNFQTVEAQIAAKAAQGAGIASVTLVPNDMLQFQLTDHSYLPPVGPLPTAQYRFRGAWTPSTPYLVNDTFSEGASGYVALVQHTSATTFDPNATDGSGHNLYGLFFQGTVSVAPVVTKTGTTWTPTLADANSYQRFTSGSAILVTIPTNASVPFPIDTEINLRQAGAGAITIVGGGGVVVNPQDGCMDTTSGQGATVTVKKVDVDEWDLMGRLEPHS